MSSGCSSPANCRASGRRHIVRTLSWNAHSAGVSEVGAGNWRHVSSSGRVAVTASYAVWALPYASSSRTRSCLSTGLSTSMRTTSVPRSATVWWNNPARMITFAGDTSTLELLRKRSVADPERTMRPVFFRGWQCSDVPSPFRMRRHQSATSAFRYIRYSWPQGLLTITSS